MVAPSAEAMRIWMDVIVTGAEGYTQFMNWETHRGGTEGTGDVQIVSAGTLPSQTRQARPVSGPQRTQRLVLCFIFNLTRWFYYVDVFTSTFSTPFCLDWKGSLRRTHTHTLIHTHLYINQMYTCQRLLKSLSIMPNGDLVVTVCWNLLFYLFPFFRFFSFFYF